MGSRTFFAISFLRAVVLTSKVDGLFAMSSSAAAPSGAFGRVALSNISSPQPS